MAWRRIRWFVVLEIGITRLMTKKDSVILLTLMFLNMQRFVLPQQSAEATEPLKKGMRIRGPFSRVAGETMTSDISRRKC